MVISQSIWVASYTLAATIAGQTSAAAESLSVAEPGFVELSHLYMKSLSAWVDPWGMKKELDSSGVSLAFTELDPDGLHQGLPIATALAVELVTTNSFAPLGVDVTVVDHSGTAIASDSATRPVVSSGMCDMASVPSAIALPLPTVSIENREAADRAPLYQVAIGKYPFIQLPDELRADWVAQRLRYQFEEFPLASMTVQLFQQNGIPEIYLNGQLILRVNDDLASYYQRSADLIAIDWANNLRVAIGQEPLTLADSQRQLYGLSYTGEAVDGIASWYGPYFHGRLTATGERFDQADLTAAHPSLPFGTYLEVINHENNQSVIVRINDRGPYVGNRSLDLSHQAAQCLDSETSGVVDYTAYLLVTVPQDQPVSPGLPGERLLALERGDTSKEGDRQPG
jgi:hypothetical protein